MKGTLYLVLGTALFLAGLWLVYGDVAQRPLGESGLTLREFTFSPGLALMGGGLFLVIRGVRARLR